MPTIINTQKRISKRDAATLLGIKVYDTALPQQWLDCFVDNLKQSGVKGELYDIILSGTVWCYDRDSFIGFPYPLTLEAFGLLKAHDMIYGSHYADETKNHFNVIGVL